MMAFEYWQSNGGVFNLIKLPTFDITVGNLNSDFRIILLMLLAFLTQDQNIQPEEILKT